MMREKLDWKSLIWILAGNTCYALAVTMFVLPNGLITGGTTGLALFFYNQLGVPVQVVVSIFNVVMFALGALMLGKKFAFTTIISTFYYPFILSVLQGIPALASPTEDKLLAVIFSGLMIGAGIGAVLRVGASTGGMDIPPLVLNKKMGIPVSLSMNVLDVGVLLLQMAFSDREGVLHGILLVLIYTTVLNRVLLMGNARMQVKIMSDKYLEINEAISSELDRGVTILRGAGAWSGEAKDVLMCAFKQKQIVALKRAVKETDPSAFLIVCDAHEVLGQGFHSYHQHDL